ncbi:MAG: class I SAM-dependent methyltransferase [Alphaproteobacteria bacterium]
MDDKPVSPADEAAAQQSPRPCPGCGRDNTDHPALAISRAPWQVKRCSGCGFVYLENAPHYESFVADFAWERTIGDEARRRTAHQPAQQRLSKATRFRMGLFPRKKIPDLLDRFAAPGPVLDLGCADAFHLTTLPDGFEPWGIEISADLARRGNENLRSRGGRVVQAPALEGLKRLDGDKFSAVIQRSYLEHELRPREVLAETRRVLKPNGVLILKLPNFASLNAKLMGGRWCGIRLPDHVNYFTPGHLRDFVSAAGLTIEKFDPLSFRQPTSDNMWMIARKPAYAKSDEG